MKHTPPSRAGRPGLAALAFFVALNAFGGAIALMTGVIDLGTETGGRLPFDSQAIGGLALALLVGVPMAVAGLSAVTGRAHTAEAAMMAGALLVGWIGVQLLVIRTFTWLQPAMVVAGLLVFTAGRRPHTGSHSEQTG